MKEHIHGCDIRSGVKLKLKRTSQLGMLISQVCVESMRFAFVRG